MRVSIPSTWRLYHHALKLAVPLYGIQIAVPRDLHWSLQAATYVLILPATYFFILAMEHQHRPDECPHCKPSTKAALRRPHNRLRMGFGRWGFAILVAAAGALLLAAPFMNEGGNDKSGFFPPSRWALALMGLLLMAAAYGSCRRYYRLNNPSRATSRELNTWLKENVGNLVHRSHTLSLVALTLALIAVPFPTGGILGTIRTVVIFLVFGAFSLERHHAMTLCEQCVIDFRTDAPEHAAARAWRFRASHRMGRVMLAFLLLALAAVFLNGIIQDVCFVMLYVAMIYSSVLTHFHVTYQPWCPICYPGGGGDDKEEVPDPTGDHGRPLPV